MWCKCQQGNSHSNPSSWLQQYVNWKLSDVQAGFRKGRGTRDQIANIHWITEKAREFQEKTSTSASLITLESLTVWIITNCGKFLKKWKYQTTLLVSWETCMWVKKQQLEPYMEQMTGSTLGNEYDQSIYCHPAYLIFTQHTSRTMRGWMNHRLESSLPGEISTTSYMQMIPL